jgi:phosphopentomutase
MINDGSQYPESPSFIQYWLEQSQEPSEKAWIIASKDKLEILADCKNPQWKGKYKPMTDCGKSGLSSGLRADSTTFNRALAVLKEHHPNVVIINFKEPDVAGHANDWKGYLKGIETTDAFCYQIWDFLQNDPIYKGTTTLFITNDHGRHPNDFTSHGDKCNSCKHIECLAIGPEIRSDYVDTVRHSQVDIAATAAKLMGVEMPDIAGKVMLELYKPE